MNTRMFKAGWILVGLLLCLPTLGLMAAGSYWLYQQADYRDWLILWPLCTAIALTLAVRLRNRQASRFRNPRRAALDPEAVDSPLDQTARAAVEQLAARHAAIPDASLGFESLDEWLTLGRETLATVAALYKPGSKTPELDIPTPWVLLITERVAHDLRHLLQERVPFSDQLTLSDGIALVRWKARLQDALFLANLTRLFFNPQAALAAATASAAQTGISQTALPLLKKWLLDSYIQQIGHYAILLYSGRLIVNANPDTNAQSEETRRDLDSIETRHAKLATEPLRILVVGQTNAGKSTLINRLQGHLRAPDDIVPCTRTVTAYPLRQADTVTDQDFEGILIDTPGFGPTLDWLKQDSDPLGTVDLLFVVCSVREAARQSDLAFLETLKTHYAARLNRRLPPIIVVATHIDQLRPAREWAPPYDIVNPETPKARAIREALEVIREDLRLDDHGADIVPVCLKDGYNLEVLWLAVARRLDDACKARILRMQEVLLEKGKYQQIVRQFIQGGRWLLGELQGR